MPQALGALAGSRQAAQGAEGGDAGVIRVAVAGDQPQIRWVMASCISVLPLRMKQALILVLH